MPPANEEVTELLIEFLREEKRERLAGHTIAILHDDMRAMETRIEDVYRTLRRHESRIVSLESARSVRPPALTPAKLEAIAQPHPDDITAVTNVRGELREALYSYKFAQTAWKIVTAVAILAAALAAVYSALHK